LSKKTTKTEIFLAFPLEANFSIPTTVSSKIYFDDDTWNK